MNRRMVFVLATMLAIGHQSFAAKATIAIGKIENKAGGKSDRQRYTTAPDTTAAFADMTSNALIKTRKFEVVERERIDEALQEQGLAEAGLTQSALKKLGGLVGADYVLIGTITQQSVDKKSFGLGRYAVDKTVARMAVDIRILEVASGSVKLAESVEMSKTGALGVRAGELVTGGQVKGILGDVMRACANEIVSRVVRAVYPIKIVSVSRKTVTLNYGDAVLRRGEVLDVFSIGEAVEDPDTGEILGQEETQVGSVKVTSVQAKMSKARKARGCGNLEKGMICRKRGRK